MIEKAIASALEPLIDDLVALQKKSEAATPEIIAAAILNDGGLVAKLKGKDGKDGNNGKDGQSVEVQQVVDLLKRDIDFCNCLKASDPAPVDVAIALAQNSEFLELIRGKDGKDADAALIVEHLKNNDEFRAQLKGEPGKDADPVDLEQIAETLKADPEFLETIKGEPGLAGLDGVGICAPPWKPGVYRKGSIIQHFIGQTFRALEDTADPPGDSPHWERVGTAGFRHRGGHKEGNVYAIGDFFVKDRATFLQENEQTRLIAGKSLSTREVTKVVESCLVDIEKRLTNAETSAIVRFKKLETQHKTIETNTLIIGELAEAFKDLRNELSTTRDIVKQLQDETMRFRGNHDSRTQYYSGNVVLDAGRLFIALKDNRAPLNDDKAWLKIADGGSGSSSSGSKSSGGLGGLGSDATLPDNIVTDTPLLLSTQPIIFRNALAELFTLKENEVFRFHGAAINRTSNSWYPRCILAKDGVPFDMSKINFELRYRSSRSKAMEEWFREEIIPVDFPGTFQLTRSPVEINRVVSVSMIIDQRYNDFCRIEWRCFHADATKNNYEDAFICWVNKSEMFNQITLTAKATEGDPQWSIFLSEVI